MLIDKLVRKQVKASSRRVLASLLCLAAGSSSWAEVVDLPTTTINPDRTASFATYDSLRQVRAQEPILQDVPVETPVPAQPPTQPPVPAQPPALPREAGQAVPAQRSPAQPPTLNVDPEADIEDLVPQPPPPPPAGLGAGRRLGLGATAGGFSAAPNMIGDLFGGSFSTFGGFQTVNFSGYAAGRILSGGPGASNSTLAFEFGTDIAPNDIFTTGLGSDLSVPTDGFADSYSIAEPIPPNDALTSPGPGFFFDGGTAVYTNDNVNTTPQPGQFQDNQEWFIAYSYTQALNGGPGGGGRPIPGPGTAARRVKLSENFSPEVRDRCFASYNFFNDAFGGLGDISRYTLGIERILVDQLISVEARLPMAGTYASTQALDRPESRDFEFGNAAFISKAVLLRTDRILWSGGLGLTIPTADDTKISQGGQQILRVENETVHLLPYMAVMLRRSRDTALQAYLQLDIAANGDPVYGNLLGGALPRLGVFNDSTLMNIDVSASHVVYRNRNRNLLRQVIGNAELHYTGTLQGSDFVSSGGLTYTNLKRNFNVVNATAGMHLVLRDNWVVTPAMSIPLRSGLDEQFDYEAVLQVNWLR